MVFIPVSESMVKSNRSGKQTAIFFLFSSSSIFEKKEKVYKFFNSLERLPVQSVLFKCIHTHIFDFLKLSYLHSFTKKKIIQYALEIKGKFPIRFGSFYYQSNHLVYHTPKLDFHCFHAWGI